MMKIPTRIAITATGLKRLSIVWAAGPFGWSEFWRLFLASSPQPASTAGTITSTATARAMRRPRALRSVMSLPDFFAGGPGARHSTWGGFHVSNLLRRFRNSESEAVERVRAALPVPLDLHPGLEVDAGAEERLELLSGPRTGLLEDGPALPD